MQTTNAALCQITATHCCVCHASLTDAESVEHGIGPVCSRRYYNPLHQPDDEQVKTALGLLAVSGLPDHIIDAFLKVVDNNKCNARLGSNVLIYWASAHYDDRAEVFRCTAIIRALGYTELADKLELDRTAAIVKETATEITTFVPDKYRLTDTLKRLPGVKATPNPDDASKQAKRGHKLGWTFKPEQKEALWTLLGFYLGGELSCGTGGIKPIPRKGWGQLQAILHPQLPAPVGRIPTPPPVTVDDPVTVTRTGDLLVVVSPYNAAFVGDLKTQIPYRERSWNPIRKCWEVRVRNEGIVRALVSQHYGVALP